MPTNLAGQAVAEGRPAPAITPAARPRAHPALWVPSLYFAMGMPMTAVTAMSAVMYKNLGLSNAEIALYTGSMYLPWVVKPLWSPVVEMFRTKKFFVLSMELVMAATLGGVAASLPLPGYLRWTITLFWLTGFASATQDIAADGVYISAMTHRQQVRSSCSTRGRWAGSAWTTCAWAPSTVPMAPPPSS